MGEHVTYHHTASSNQAQRSGRGMKNYSFSPSSSSHFKLAKKNFCFFKDALPDKNVIASSIFFFDVVLLTSSTPHMVKAIESNESACFSNMRLIVPGNKIEYKTC